MASKPFFSRLAASRFALSRLEKLPSWTYQLPWAGSAWGAAGDGDAGGGVVGAGPVTGAGSGAAAAVRDDGASPPPAGAASSPGPAVGWPGVPASVATGTGGTGIGPLPAPSGSAAAGSAPEGPAGPGSAKARGRGTGGARSAPSRWMVWVRRSMGSPSGSAVTRGGWPPPSRIRGTTTTNAPRRSAAPTILSVSCRSIGSRA